MQNPYYFKFKILKPILAKKAVTIKPQLISNNEFCGLAVSVTKATTLPKTHFRQAVEELSKFFSAGFRSFSVFS